MRLAGWWPDSHQKRPAASVKGVFRVLMTSIVDKIRLELRDADACMKGIDS